VIKQQAPNLAKAVSNYAVTQGKAYLDRSKREGPVAAVIEQALFDLPTFTANVIRKYEEQKQSGEQPRGAGPGLTPGELAQLVQALIINCMPAIRQRVDETIRPKLQQAVIYAKPIMFGNRDALHSQGRIQDVIQMWGATPSDDCLGLLCCLLENLIYGGICGAMQIDRHAPIGDIATGAMQLVNHGSSMWQTQQLLRDIRLTQSTEPKSPDCAELMPPNHENALLRSGTGAAAQPKFGHLAPPPPTQR
jgi:hypothetical protein